MERNALASSSDLKEEDATLKLVLPRFHWPRLDFLNRHNDGMTSQPEPELNTDVERRMYSAGDERKSQIACQRRKSFDLSDQICLSFVVNNRTRCSSGVAIIRHRRTEMMLWVLMAFESWSILTAIIGRDKFMICLIMALLTKLLSQKASRFLHH